CRSSRSAARGRIRMPRRLPWRREASSFFLLLESAGILTPDFLRDLNHQFQLALLVVLAQPVADLARGEAALRREAEILQWDVFRRLVDALLQHILLLQRRRLGRDQPEDHFLVLGTEAKGFESPGTGGVVLEEEAVHRGLEDSLG